jgi:hypothetical protein
MAEAKLARDLLLRATFLVERSPDPHDDWLNAVRALTKSEADLHLSGRAEGREHQGRAIEHLEIRSADACVLLAGGSRPK